MTMAFSNRRSTVCGNRRTGQLENGSEIPPCRTITFDCVAEEASGAPAADVENVPALKPPALPVYQRSRLRDMPAELFAPAL